jgi:membrane-associated phospholipid phosphatase
MFFFKKFQRSLFRAVSAAAVVTLLAGTAVAVEKSGTLPEISVTEAKVDSAQTGRINLEYVKSYFSDTSKIVTSPTSWNKSDLLAAGLVIGATTGLYLADTDIRDFSRRNQSSTGDKSASVGNALGDPLFVLPSLGLFYLYGHINDDSKARQTSLLAVESVAISGVFTWTLKEIAQRPRPDSGESSTTWDGPGKKLGDYSFPSGHTTVAFSVASVVADQYYSNPYVAPVAYGLATLTGLSRVYSDKHWASDAFAGAAIGYFTGKAIVKYHTAEGKSAVMILPTVSQQGVGMMAEYRF